MKPLRVLVVDDSAYNRRTISQVLGMIAGVEVVGKASDGDEALRMVGALTPDLITLDLEMPRMDGFTFLRLLMAKRPTPVIVVSGLSAKENVFRALELGALDFVAKADRTVGADMAGIVQELTEKVRLVRHLTPATFDPTRRPPVRVPSTPPLTDDGRRLLAALPKRLVLIGASTGGPKALLEVFDALESNAPISVVVAQHMPERFTRTFAARLDRLQGLRVQEATDGCALRAGAAFVCPGGRCVEVAGDETGFLLRVVSPSTEDRYVPSVDRLFETGARVAGARVVAVVLTGMGDDGARGISMVKSAGGEVLAESQETAVIFGMPGAAIRTGLVDEVLPLPDLAGHLAGLAK